jgi:hypothetical protein
MNNPNAENTQHNTQDPSHPALDMSAIVADLQHQAAALQAVKAKKDLPRPSPKTA